MRFMNNKEIVVNYKKILEEIKTEVEPLIGSGKLANYIPELANVNANHFGIEIRFIDGNSHAVGDTNTQFSIQSISKVFALTLAIKLVGNEVWKRVGVEPSGNAFNSLVQLEHENGIPRNPLINAGALVISDILISNLKQPKNELLEFVRKISNNQKININKKVAVSEKENGFRNAALANMMKSFGNIKNDIDEVLDLYFCMCSIEMTCSDLSEAFLLYCNHGILPQGGEKVISLSQTKRLNALMQTCGFYDEAGEFSFKVGLPGKSGVGGGIVAVLPGKFSIASWSPELNKKGNSVLSMKALELFTTKTKLSVF